MKLNNIIGKIAGWFFWSSMFLFLVVGIFAFFKGLDDLVGDRQKRCVAIYRDIPLHDIDKHCQKIVYKWRISQENSSNGDN